MPTKRRRKTHARIEPNPAELQWLTGKPVEGASKLWRFIWNDTKARRCKTLLITHAHLIPKGRMAELRGEVDQSERRYRGGGVIH